MINVEFLKTLTLLYVEDDHQVRDKFVVILNKLFKQVFVAVDGVDGLEKFHQSNKDKAYIDLIISDIAMPNMDGMEFLENIRKINTSVPFIFTTAHTNTEFLISSIQEGVSDYFVKPVDTKAIIQKVQTTCELRKKDKEILHYQKEAQKYLDVINKVAMVTIFDHDGNFTFVNDFYIEVSEYSEEELIGKNFQMISHPDMSKQIFKDQWTSLKNGKNWKGKLKHLSKNGQAFYTYTTIIPMNFKDKRIDTKYISIRFLTTKDENEKREFKRKVLYNLQETKKINKVSTSKIEVLKNKIAKYKNLVKIEEKLESQKVISAKYYTKIKDLEHTIEDVQKGYENLMISANSEIRDILTVATEVKTRKEAIQQDVSVVQSEIQVREELIKRLRIQVHEQSKKIKDLKDVVSHRETQLSSKI